MFRLSDERSTGSNVLKSKRFWWLLSGTCLVIGLILVRDPRLIRLLSNSWLLAVGTCFLSLPTGTWIGLLLFRTNFPFRRFFLCLTIAGLFLPLYLYAAAWSAGFGQLGWFPLIGEPPRPILSGWFGAIWVHSMAALPWVILIVGVGSLSVDADTEEAALLESSPLSVLFHITLPATGPAILVAEIWILIVTMGEMTITDIFRIRTYIEEVFLNLQLDSFSLVPIIRPWEDQNSYSIDFWTQLMMLFWLILSVFLMASMVIPMAKIAKHRPSLIFQLRDSKLPLFLVVCFVFVFLMGLPLFNLVHKAGLQHVVTANGAESFWSLELLWQNIRAVPGRYGADFYWTVLIGIATATLSLIVTLPLAWLARTGGRIGSLPALFVATVGFAMPGPMIAVAVIALLDHPDSELMVWLYDRTLFAPVIAITIRALPLTILFCWQAMRSISENALDHARLDGISNIERFWHFGIRQNTIAIATVWVIAIVIAMGDLSSSSLVIPPGIDSIQRRIFGMIHSGVNDQVAIASLANICFVLPWIVLLGWLVQRKSNYNV